MVKKRQLINRKRLLDSFTELIKINSPSYEEEEIGDILSVKLKACGCRVEKQNYGSSFNLMAYKKGNLPKVPTLLLSAHMDTIEPTSGIRYAVKNGAVRSTGSTVLGADDKSAIAQILEALAVINESDVSHGDIEIVFTSAEEKGLFGARNIKFRNLKSRHALVLDAGGEVGRIVTAAPAHYTYDMRITGRPAHAGIEPEKGINAIRVAAKIISALPDGRIDDETTANIGKIKGGTATNVVAKEVVIRGEVRSHDSAKLKKTIKTIYETAEKTAAENRAKLEIIENREYERFRIQKDEPFLCYLDNVFKQCGISPVHIATGGGSDANIFNKKGILALNISTGMQNVHSHDEFIRIEDLYKGAVIVLQAITDFRKLRKS